MAQCYYEITVPNKEYTNYGAEKRYGVQFVNGVVHVADDQMWVVSGRDGPGSLIRKPVWQVFEEDHGYTVRKLEPTEAPIREPAVKATDPRRARD